MLLYINTVPVSEKDTGFFCGERIFKGMECKDSLNNVNTERVFYPHLLITWG